MDLQELKNNKKDVVRIHLKAGEPNRRKSKVGGTPYWPENTPYPDMLFIAQINFEDVPRTELLPTKGILQFFVGTDECFGLFEKEHGFKVFYHEDTDSLADISPVIVTDSPINAPASMTFLKDKECISYSDASFPAIPDALEEVLYHDDAFNGAGDKLLGYPFFTQTDPREYDPKLQKYDTLLFQLDTSDFVMWGDCGVANFFINKNKLKAKDFSDILYNWDCC